MNNLVHNSHAKVDDSDSVTPARHRNVISVASAYQAIRDGADVEETLHDLVVTFLEPRERSVYEWFCVGGAGGYTDSASVALVFEISRTDSGSILKLLCDVGLLERVREAHAHGGRYLYGMPGVHEEVFS